MLRQRFVTNEIPKRTITEISHRCISGIPDTSAHRCSTKVREMKIDELNALLGLDSLVGCVNEMVIKNQEICIKEINETKKDIDRTLLRISILECNNLLLKNNMKEIIENNQFLRLKIQKLTDRIEDVEEDMEEYLSSVDTLLNENIEINDRLDCIETDNTSEDD